MLSFPPISTVAAAVQYLVYRSLCDVGAAGEEAVSAKLSAVRFLSSIYSRTEGWRLANKGRVRVHRNEDKHRLLRLSLFSFWPDEGGSAEL